MKIALDYSKIDDVEMFIDTHDAPDFCDCYIESFTYDGREATQEEVDALNDDGDYVHEMVLKCIY